MWPLVVMSALILRGIGRRGVQGEGLTRTVRERVRDIRSCTYHPCMRAVQNRSCLSVEESFRREYWGATSCCRAEERGKGPERGHCATIKFHVKSKLIVVKNFRTMGRKKD
jgi:hypothetical protein